MTLPDRLNRNAPIVTLLLYVTQLFHWEMPDKDFRFKVFFHWHLINYYARLQKITLTDPATLSVVVDQHLSGNGAGYMGRKFKKGNMRMLAFYQTTYPNGSHQVYFTKY